MNEPAEHYVDANGIRHCYFEWQAELKGQRETLLFVHANGYHARIWDPVIRHFPDYHILSLDLRAHGRSEQTAINHWRQFGEDIEALVAHLAIDRFSGIGHSMGGHALVQAVAAHQNRFKHLILIDPAIISPADYARPASGQSYADPRDHPAARRREYFRNSDAMYERFHGREPYTVFTDEALYSYCHFGLVPAPDHDPGFRLACRPVTEASVYMAAHSNGRIYDSIRAINIPVLILRAQEPTPNKPVQNYSVSPTWPGLVDSFHSAREIYYPDCTHFLPMEIPDEIAQRIREQLGSHAKQDEGAAR